jgi:predicted XRE-type DNA-binding protein
MNTETIAVAKAAIQLFAETHPRPSHVTQAQAAEMLGISRPTVGKMVKSGIFRLNKCSLIPIIQIDEAISAKRAA